MKTNVLSLFTLAGALALTAACASEDTTNKQEQQQETKGLTAFVVEDNATRTTGEYDGSGINFYWTEGDRLWVNNGTLIQDASNTISDVLTNNTTTPGAVKRAAKASFSFEGTFTAQNYPVRYTGKGSTVGDKVTIKAAQTQTVPNDAAHIGEDGDCGTATATRPTGSNQYKFTLTHKASYITFVPYSTFNFSGAVMLRQVKITADEALSGQFNFTDAGIDLASRPAPTPANRSITLTLGGIYSGKIVGFGIPVVVTPKYDAAVMVIPPGTYHNVSIEYTLYDSNTEVYATIKKEYPTLTFTAGKNKKISTDLKLMKVLIIPMGGFLEGHGPNTNETMWYIHRGDPHWDPTPIYAARRSPTMPASICSGGIWIKKKANIPGFSGTKAPNGVNYIAYESGMGMVSRVNNYAISLPKGIPANINDYYFMPSVLPYGSTEVTSKGGAFRYWMGTRCALGWDLGQVFASDVPPGVSSPNIGIGCGFRSSIMAYWDAQ